MKNRGEHGIPRREFIHRSAIGLGGLALAPLVARAAGTAAGSYDPTEVVELGRSALASSRLCLGTGANGFNRQSNHTRMGAARFSELIRGSYERGVRMFDLADAYGTHPFFAPAVRGLPRDSYQIVSKIWFRTGGIPEPERPDADVVVERFLRELGTDYIDLLLLHCAVSPRWPEELSRQMEIIARLKEKGVVRAHGVSCHSLEALRAAVTEPWVDSVHARINPYGMSMDGPPEDVVPVLRQLRAAGKGVVGMKIVGNGRLRDDPERRAESVRFALGLDCVDILLVGCETLPEVDDMSALIRRVPRAAA